MAKLLEKALAEIAKLPEDEQETLAQWILDEIAAERRWDDLLAKSQDLLKEWADQALADRQAGKTIPLYREDE